MKKFLFALIFSLVALPCWANTYAHIESGQALDPQVNASAAEYLSRYTSQITAGWTVQRVLDGTQHNATVGAQIGGVYQTTNPVVQTVSVPVPITEADFIQLAQTAGGMTDNQLVACKSDAAYAALWIKFNAAPLLERDDPRVQLGLAALAAGGYLPNGAAAVTAAWPKR